MEQESRQEILISSLRYIVEAAEYLTAAELQEVVEKLYGDEIMPTIAEQWLEEGRQKGLKEGLEQGLERGRETAFKLLRRFVAWRFETALDQFDERLERLDLAAIDRLADRQ